MFNEKDKSMIMGLKKILDDATFPLKKREVQSFALVMNWVNELEQRIYSKDNKQEEVKEVKKTKKKTNKRASDGCK